MEIKNITITSFIKESFNNKKVEGLHHIKTLSCLSVVQSTDGFYEFSSNGGKHKDTGEGGFFLAPAFAVQDIIHHVNKNSGLMSARWVFMDVLVNNLYPFDSLFSYPYIADEETKKKLNFLFNKLFASEDIIENKICCYEIMKVLFAISNDKKKINPYISVALNYMNKNFRNHITVDSIAKEAGISPSRLFALFQEHTDCSPIAYLNNLRLSYACLLLESTNKTIGEIAGECGIDDIFYFSKIFKKQHGISPKEYRKSLNL